jgi:hypothetical protein
VRGLISIRIVYKESRAIWRDPIAEDGCDSCHQRGTVSEKQRAVWEDDRLVVNGEEFHRYDFVLFDEGQTGVAWSIGHIVSWPKHAKRNRPKQIEMRLLKRTAELVFAGTIKGLADDVSAREITRDAAKSKLMYHRNASV